MRNNRYSFGCRPMQRIHLIMKQIQNFFLKFVFVCLHNDKFSNSYPRLDTSLLFFYLSLSLSYFSNLIFISKSLLSLLFLLICNSIPISSLLPNTVYQILKISPIFKEVKKKKKKKKKKTNFIIFFYIVCSDAKGSYCYGWSIWVNTLLAPNRQCKVFIQKVTCRITIAS